MTVAGPRRICTGFLHHHRLTRDIVALRLLALGRIVQTDSPPIVETEDGGREQCWPLPADEESLLGLIHVCFDEYWDEIWFGILIEGAAWEVAAPNPPTRISMYDGYATVDFGR